MPDHAGTPVAGLAAVHPAGPVSALVFRDHVGRFHHAAGADGFFDRRVDRVKLVIAGDDLVQPVALGVFPEDDEMLEQFEEPALLEDPPDEHLDFVTRLRRIAFAVDGAPDLEPFLVGRERADARLRAVAHHEEFVVVQQRGDFSPVGLELLEGIPNRGLLVGRIFQLDDRERETIEKNHDVGPAVVAGFDDGELIHREPVVRERVVEIHQSHLVALDRAVGPGILHVHAIAQHLVKGAVRPGERRRPHAQHFAQRLLARLFRNLRIQPRHRRPQSSDQHHLSERIPLRRRLAGREMRPMSDRIAQLPEPAERGIFDGGFVEAHGWDWFTRRRGDAEVGRLLTMRWRPSLSVAAPKLMSRPTGRFIRRR